MKAAKALLAVGGALLVAAVVVGVFLLNRQAEPQSAIPIENAAAAIQQSVSPPAPTPSRQAPETLSHQEKANTLAGEPRPARQPQSRTPPTAPPAPAKQKPELQDPLARGALALVGADPEAEAYWLAAIFDTTLPDEEREDLMEDLNEDGLSDFKYPGPWDLPLINNRLLIIEDVAPYADEFMLPHLAEAYKDLLNLGDVAMGGGEPVR